MGKYIYIKLNSDDVLFIFFLCDLEKQRGIDYKHVNKNMEGLENVLALTSQWQPENTSTVPSIEASTMRELVSSYIKAP